MVSFYSLRVVVSITVTIMGSHILLVAISTFYYLAFSNFESTQSFTLSGTRWNCWVLASNKIGNRHAWLWRYFARRNSRSCPYYDFIWLPGKFAIIEGISIKKSKFKSKKSKFNFRSVSRLKHFRCCRTQWHGLPALPEIKLRQWRWIRNA